MQAKRFNNQIRNTTLFWIGKIWKRTWLIMLRIVKTGYIRYLNLFIYPLKPETTVILINLFTFSWTYSLCWSRYITHKMVPCH